jgi:hypothetical protein
VDAIEYGLMQHGVRLTDARLERLAPRSERPPARV